MNDSRFPILKSRNVHLQILHKQIDPPDVVKGLGLVDYYAACGTPVAVEEVLHDAAFTNWEKMKYITV